MYFEDLEVGRAFELGSRTFTLERILEFASEFDPQPIHLDAQAARDSLYGGIIASGWHTGSTLMGLLASGFLNNTSSQGSPGLDELRWRKPVYPGDTVHGKATVLAARESRSRPDMGLVQIRSELLGEDGEPVLSMVSWGLFTKRT